jgi:hypothetical protein
VLAREAIGCLPRLTFRRSPAKGSPTVRFRSAGAGAAARLFWMKDNGAWRITAYDVERPWRPRRHGDRGNGRRGLLKRGRT